MYGYEDFALRGKRYCTYILFYSHLRIFSARISSRKNLTETVSVTQVKI